MHDLTDRGIVYAIKDNAVYQLFCGKDIVKKWHFPDHNKIEEFRSRLSGDTQRRLGNIISKQAAILGFCDSAHIDIGSTVQEVNTHYPADSSLLCKMSTMAKRAADYMNEKVYDFRHKQMEVNLKFIKEGARKFFIFREKRNTESMR